MPFIFLIWVGCVLWSIAGWGESFVQGFSWSSTLYWLSFAFATSPIWLLALGFTIMGFVYLNALLFKKKKVRRIAYEIELRIDDKGLMEFCCNNYMSIDLEKLMEYRNTLEKPRDRKKLLEKKFFE